MAKGENFEFQMSLAAIFLPFPDLLWIDPRIDNHLVDFVFVLFCFNLLLFVCFVLFVCLFVFLSESHVTNGVPLNLKKIHLIRDTTDVKSRIDTSEDLGPRPIINS